MAVERRHDGRDAGTRAARIEVDVEGCRDQRAAGHGLAQRAERRTLERRLGCDLCHRAARVDRDRGIDRTIRQGCRHRRQGQHAVPDDRLDLDVAQARVETGEPVDVVAEIARERLERAQIERRLVEQLAAARPAFGGAAEIADVERLGREPALDAHRRVAEIGLDRAGDVALAEMALELRGIGPPGHEVGQRAEAARNVDRPVVERALDGERDRAADARRLERHRRQAQVADAAGRAVAIDDVGALDTDILDRRQLGRALGGGRGRGPGRLEAPVGPPRPVGFKQDLRLDQDQPDDLDPTREQRHEAHLDLQALDPEHVGLRSVGRVGQADRLGDERRCRREQVELEGTADGERAAGQRPGLARR